MDGLSEFWRSPLNAQLGARGLFYGLGLPLILSWCPVLSVWWSPWSHLPPPHTHTQKLLPGQRLHPQAWHTVCSLLATHTDALSGQVTGFWILPGSWFASCFYFCPLKLSSPIPVMCCCCSHQHRWVPCPSDKMMQSPVASLLDDFLTSSTASQLPIPDTLACILYWEACFCLRDPTWNVPASGTPPAVLLPCCGPLFPCFLPEAALLYWGLPTHRIPPPFRLVLTLLFPSLNNAHHHLI